MTLTRNASISFIMDIFQVLASTVLALFILLALTQNLALLSFDSSLMRALFPICPADLKLAGYGLEEMTPRFPPVNLGM